MFFNIALYTSLAIFGIGLLYKLLSWFLKDIGLSTSEDTAFPARVGAGLKVFFGTIFSVRIFTIIKVFILDVLFQARILKDSRDPIVWIMHFLIFVGFMGLLIFHALSSYFSVALDPDYQSTLNPFMFLRNLFGALALVGLVLSVVRRASLMKGRIKTTGMDIYAIGIVALIVVSGFLLEGAKINSRSAFMRMVTEFGDADDTEGTLALESYWVKHYGLVSPKVKQPISDETLAEGKEWHEMACQDCHSKPESAFLSYAIAKVTAPVSPAMDKAGYNSIMWYVHVLSCFFGLAFLAFTKMFHIFSTPLSIMAAEVARTGESKEAAATRRAIEVEGCNHGGMCHSGCPVRTKRQERIDQVPQFDPVLEYIAKKSGKDLGNREITD